MRPALVVALALVAAACSNAETSSPSTSPSTTTSIAATTSTTAPPTTAGTAVLETPTTTASEDAVTPGDVEGTVGFVGCSMSQNSVEGYEALGGSAMWSHRAPYGGGGIGRWFADISGDRGRYWEGFSDQLAAHPDTTAIWLNLCTVRQNQLDSFDSAAAVIDEINERVPDATIYVSAQPDYTDGHACGLAGDGGPEAMADIAAQLVDAGLALPGPVMGPLDESETRDGCHANEDGQQALGRQLLDFFG